MGWTRRDLMRWLGLGGAATLLGTSGVVAGTGRRRRTPSKGADEEGLWLAAAPGPVIAATWPHGLAATRRGQEILEERGSALDAVEAGARVSEADPDVSSVGLGGSPNEDGVVQLDAAVMDGGDRDRPYRAGAVGALEGVRHPVSVARKVMERTRHVFLVGEGAATFARRMGFPTEDLLTEAARERWLRWRSRLSESDNWLEEPAAPSRENHDTIGLVARDARGRIAAACTTSGLAWKLAGRVGDSPLVGHGLYADGEVGAAAATGVGETVIRACGSFLVVEKLRQGLEPEEACLQVLERIRRREGKGFTGQVGFVALRRDGAVGGACLRPGYSFAVARGGAARMFEGRSLA